MKLSDSLTGGLNGFSRDSNPLCAAPRPRRHYAATPTHTYPRPLPFDPSPPILVVTGFVATNSEGVPTTLKRSGSDYSATIFGKLLRWVGHGSWVMGHGSWVMGHGSKFG